MKYYAVIDTNVIVSAMLKTNSTPSRVIYEALKGDIIPVLNNEIIAEYEEVLSRPKFHFEQKAVRVFMEELKKRAVYSEQGLIEDEIPDLEDVVFYAVLMEKRKEEETYLVTGNLKHFPTRSYVVTPREMLDIIEACKS
jgi:putative PIN family toxin of toxin-antitoxin system